MKTKLTILSALLLVGLASAFVDFADDKEYEFIFQSKFELTPAVLGGGQLVNATILVRKFGKDGSSFVVRIKNSVASGTLDSDATTNIEGVFGIKRNSSGKITHFISKSTTAKGILAKKSIVDMLVDNFSFFSDYLRNPDQKQNVEHLVSQSIGLCSSTVKAETDDSSDLTVVLAQSVHAKCQVDPLVLSAGQLLLHGTTHQLGEIKSDSNVGMRVMFQTSTGMILEASKFTFLNLVVLGMEVQARHNMVIDYVTEHAITSETDFPEPYLSFSKENIDDFIRDLTRKQN